MDNRDGPLKVLATAIGDTVEDYYDDVATPELHAEAVEYFRDRDLHQARADVRIPPDGPDRPETATLTVYQGRQDHPDNKVLQNGYPASLTIDGRTQPARARISRATAGQIARGMS